MLNRIDPLSWKQDMPAFSEKAHAFQAGEITKNEYKGFSVRFGSYAQRDSSVNMLRLRMTAGRCTAKKLAYIAESIRKYHVDMVHFTTCQAVQFHNLDVDSLCAIMDGALDVGIVTIGGGGDFPRNTMCSPLTGVEKEYFNVLPYAEAAAEYALHFVNAEKMPRKLKVGFSNSPANLTHATFRDLGFAAREDGLFDVYSAGGLGNGAKFGVLMAEAVKPEDILYYIKAMWLTFRAYGNYENRAKARTRYMQDVCGGPEGYRKAYLEKLEEVFASGEDLKLVVEQPVIAKKGDGSVANGTRIRPQVQEGLYSVYYHPIGGQPSVKVLCEVSDYVSTLQDVEMRLCPDESAWFINLTGEEAMKLAAMTEEDSAKTLFETSVSCIGASICQVGLRDSQALLRACVEAVRAAGIPDGALPQMHVSGCPSSCGTHQIGAIGFRGFTKRVDNEPKSAFTLFVGGCDTQGMEKMGREAGVILETEIPSFLVELGREVAKSGMDYAAWTEQDPEGIDRIAAKYAG